MENLIPIQPQAMKDQPDVTPQRTADLFPSPPVKVVCPLQVTPDWQPTPDDLRLIQEDDGSVMEHESVQVIGLSNTE
jgi:hypothetical protein